MKLILATLVKVKLVPKCSWVWSPGGTELPAPGAWEDAWECVLQEPVGCAKACHTVLPSTMMLEC